jgi:hypothetical protein
MWVAVKLRFATLRSRAGSFVVVEVDSDLLADAASRREAHEAAQLLFPRRAVVLAGTSPGRLVYSGAPRLIELLVDVDPDKLPWRELVLP